MTGQTGERNKAHTGWTGNGTHMERSNENVGLGRHSKKTDKLKNNVSTDTAGQERDRQIGNSDDRQTLTDK